MTVKELREILDKFPDNLEVYDSSLYKIEKIKQTTLIHSNYPYNKPDEEIVIIS